MSKVSIILGNVAAAAVSLGFSRDYSSSQAIQLRAGRSSEAEKNDVVAAKRKEKRKRKEERERKKKDEKKKNGPEEEDWSSIGYQLMMVNRTEIAVMSDGRKVSIRRITSKRNPARGGREGKDKRGGGGGRSGE